MFSTDIKLSKALEEEKDPLEIDENVQIKQEVVDDFESDLGSTININEIIIKKEINDNGLNTILHHSTSSGVQKVININDSSTNHAEVVKILPFTKNAEVGKKYLGFSNKTLNIKKEHCDCMQNIEYYCSKCDKMLLHINEVKQCSECNSQLKLQCQMCHKRYKLLKSIKKFNISTNVMKEIDIKEEEKFFCYKCNFKTTEKKLFNDHIIKYNHQSDILSVNGSSTVSKTKKEELFCYKCEFSTKNKKILNSHILTSHWQPKFDVKLNCDDDMYIELLCKKCQKICRKVVYDNLVKLVCRECQLPMLYRCTLCRIGYKLLKNVRYHVKLVCPYRTNNEKFYCADCTFKSETKTKLENHIIKKHLNQQCSNCNTLFEDNDSLREHVLEHCTVKKDNIYPIQLELASREPVDENEKFIIFQYNPQILVKNVNGKPPKETKEWRNLIDYLCLECGDEAKKKFARYRPWCRKCNLKYDYRCISCERLYGNYDRILHHVKFNCSNRMVFECPLCNFNASKKSLLVTHIQTKHTIYKCMECFTNVEGFAAMKKHHTVDCSKGRSDTAIQLKKLISLYCKQCFQRPKNAAFNTTREKCEKCNIILNYQCLRCFNLFNRQDLAYKHIKELCKQNFSCLFEKCTFKTYTQKGLDTHTKYKHTNRMCSDCGVSFKDEVIFELHRREEIRRKTMEHISGMGSFSYPKRFRSS
ncbi:zinc finger protein 99-like [Phymastichus coffea]|uniref:zinc finger protein 99-like n=1 Tax=Phymastichus coffea TaxID=108790 RepID=UPI00273C9FE1|nr:zinc finger protein 99-like [Phymastichus coffea]XP_058804625.1 zinc finger protein 99-like [Phymastichus coffea]XP_058804626.1 zinc finger protein 99-like [Phymastichus coffea]